MALIQWRWLLLPYCITTATVWPLSPLTFHFPHPAIASNARTSVANCVHCSRSSFQRRGSCNIRTMSCLKIVTHFVKWSRFSSEISLILSASPRGEIWQTTWRCKLCSKCVFVRLALAYFYSFLNYYTSASALTPSYFLFTSQTCTDFNWLLLQGVGFMCMSICVLLSTDIGLLFRVTQ